VEEITASDTNYLATRNRKKALIVGVSGQDGAFLAQLLLAKGYDVFGTSRDVPLNHFSSIKNIGIFDQVKLVSMAPTDFRSVLQTVTKVEPDEIYNLAGQSSVGLSFEQPVETLESILKVNLNFLEVLRYLQKPIRFYNAGSGECFGNTPPTGADESTPFNPRSPYGVAKVASTHLVANYRESFGIFACTGILFNHESHLRPERFVTRKVIESAIRISKGSREKLSLGDLSIRRDWGWAPEYVEAMWLMLQLDCPSDLVIATGEMHSLEEFVAAAFNSLGLNWKNYVESDRTLLRPSEISISCGNPSKAQETIKWRANKKMPEVIRAIIGQLD